MFVLTHYAREPPVMEGGTTFQFVTDGIHAALEYAREAAGARDVKIGGGVSTVRQYLQAGLIDELHFAFSPVLLGRGEAMFEGLDLPSLGYRVMECTATDLATHVVLGHREEERPSISAGSLPDTYQAANHPSLAIQTRDVATSAEWAEVRSHPWSRHSTQTDIKGLTGANLRSNS